MISIERIKFWVYVIFRLLLLSAGITAALHNSWINVFVSASTLFITFLPSIIERKFRIDYPSEFEIVVLVFIYASVYLGDMHDFYLRFWWWDVFLHGLSGIIIGAIGFSLIYILNRTERSAVKLNRGFAVLFAFCFSLSIGALWEIYEFLMDRFFGMQMQRFGLNDTMMDLILDVCGALVVSVAGYRYLKYDTGFMRVIVKRFLRLNPKRPAR